MTELVFPTPTRRVCHASGRELRAGERYVGVIVEAGNGLARLDFAPDAWKGPPANAVGYWTGRVPDGESRRMPAINDEALLRCFRKLADETDGSRLSFRYVAALLLIRRRRLKLNGSRRDELGELLTLTDVRTGEALEVRNPRLTEEQLRTVQNEVFEFLGWDA